MTKIESEFSRVKMRCVSVVLVSLGALAVFGCGGAPDDSKTDHAPAAVAQTAPISASATAASIARDPPPPQKSPFGLDIPARDPRAFSGRNEIDVRQSVAHAQAAFAQSPNAGSLFALANSQAELAQAQGFDAGAQPRKDAIANYLLLKNDYPSSPLAPDALYYAGLESEIGGNAQGARRALFSLIQQHPDSRFVPYAYFAFGELFFADSKSDPSKTELGSQAFLQVIKYPPEKNPLYAWSLLRLVQLAKIDHDDPMATAMLRKLDDGFPGSEAAVRAHASR